MCVLPDSSSSSDSRHIQRHLGEQSRHVHMKYMPGQSFSMPFAVCLSWVIIIIIIIRCLGFLCLLLVLLLLFWIESCHLWQIRGSCLVQHNCCSILAIRSPGRCYEDDNVPIGSVCWNIDFASSVLNMSVDIYHFFESRKKKWLSERMWDQKKKSLKIRKKKKKFNKNANALERRSALV